MIIPKLFFVFDKKYNVLTPLTGQNSDLSSYVSNQNWSKYQYEQYNGKSLNIINSSNLNTLDMYWSDEYDWNGNYFQFHNIHVCDEKDLEEYTTLKSQFDFHVNYTVNDTTVVEEFAIKDNILYKIKTEYPCLSVENDGFYIDKKNWQFLVRNILKKKNSILIGPTGTGKTELVIRICTLMNIPCRVYDMGSMQDPLTDLLGSHRLQNGNSVFDYAKFVDDVQKPGVIVLDELSRAPLITNNILFPCLDSRRTLPIEIADSKSERSIKIHNDCVFIATANIGQEYSGTNEIDAALLNRFLPIQLDYLPSSFETQVLIKRTGINKEDATKIVSIANRIREEYNIGNLTKSISTRETLEIAELISDGFSLLDSIDFVINQKYIHSAYNDEYIAVKKLLIEF